ncbi:MAG TPA: YggS family pyridoxal phosphate-dependent enzyme [Nitrospirales bacterium]
MEDRAEREEFNERLERVRMRVERAAHSSGRNPAEVRVIAVTKTVAPERVLEAASCGCRTFGESRVQEAIAKMEALGGTAGLEWHFLGPLQTNKIKAIIGRFSLLHAIDRVDVAERLQRALQERNMVQPVLLEVNVSGEPSKHGFSPDTLMEAAGKVANFKNIEIKGLMTIAPAAASPEDSRPHFRHLKQLALRLESERIPGVGTKELSMGMSGDFECAIQEGATMVRIGSALFGSRETEHRVRAIAGET